MNFLDELETLYSAKQRFSLNEPLTKVEELVLKKYLGVDLLSVVIEDLKKDRIAFYKISQFEVSKRDTIGAGAVDIALDAFNRLEREKYEHDEVLNG